MKKVVITLGLSICVLIGIFGLPIADGAEPSAFVPPTDAQIVELAKDPSLLADLIKNANEDEIVEVLLRTIAAIDQLGLTPESARQRVGALLEETIRIQGAAGQSIVARVVKKVNPRLLPIIFMGIPPTAPRYPRQ